LRSIRFDNGRGLCQKAWGKERTEKRACPIAGLEWQTLNQNLARHETDFAIANPWSTRYQSIRQWSLPSLHGKTA
jgi:hypothetical protein